MGIDAEMFVKTTAPVTDKQIRKWAWELGGAFYRDGFYFPILERKDKHEQDGDTIEPQPGETFINVNLATRYYGPEYERGDLCLILGVAEWLKRHIPSSQVWYGGDSSGVCAKRLTVERTQELWAHFLLVGHFPYQQYFSRHGELPTCPRCQEPMLESGGGGGDTFCFCYGCDNKAIKTPSRVVWYTERDGDAFKIHQEMVEGKR